MISYTITVCNEAEEFNLLLGYLLQHISDDDEIVIQADSEKVTTEIEDIVSNYIDKFSKLVYVKFPLKDNFSDFKNNLKTHCSKEWIFNIDADEVPSEFLIQNLHLILNDNENVEMILIQIWNVV